MKICPKCGYKNKADANFCGNCQAPMDNFPITSKCHSKLLMIFIGIIVILIAILLFMMGMRSNNRLAESAITVLLLLRNHQARHLRRSFLMKNMN